MLVALRPRDLPGQDAAIWNKDGHLWIVRRIDDDINVSAHPGDRRRGIRDPAHGQAIVAYVTLMGDLEGCAEMEDEIREHVAGRSLGPSRSSGPTTCRNLPGKILRRLLRDVAEGRALGD